MLAVFLGLMNVQSSQMSPFNLLSTVSTWHFEHFRGSLSMIAVINACPKGINSPFDRTVTPFVLIWLGLRRVSKHQPRLNFDVLALVAVGDTT